MGNRFYVKPDNSSQQNLLNTIGMVHNMQQSDKANQLAEARNEIMKQKAGQDERRINLMGAEHQEAVRRNQVTEGLSTRAQDLAEKKFSAAEREQEIANTIVDPMQVIKMRSSLRAVGEKYGIKLTGSKPMRAFFNDTMAMAKKENKSRQQVYQTLDSTWDERIKPIMEHGEKELTQLYAENDTEKAQHLEAFMADLSSKRVLVSAFQNTVNHLNRQAEAHAAKLGKSTPGSLTEGSITKNLLDLSLTMEGDEQQNYARLYGQFRELMDGGMSRENAYNQVLQANSVVGPDDEEKPKLTRKRSIKERMTSDYSSIWR